MSGGPGSGAGGYEPLHPERLTWAALLGRWVAFAQQAVGLPEDAAGRRWRGAVPDIIGLQAVWMALRELGDLPRDEQAIGLDKAQVLIERHAGALRQRWGGEPLPEPVAELIGDAEAALGAARAGYESGGDGSGDAAG